MWSVGGGGGSDCRLLLFHHKLFAVYVITREKSGNVGVTSVEAFIQQIY
jgi:hypothetical protein